MMSATVIDFVSNMINKLSPSQATLGLLVLIYVFRYIVPNEYSIQRQLSIKQDEHFDQWCSRAEELLRKISHVGRRLQVDEEFDSKKISKISDAAAELDGHIGHAPDELSDDTLVHIEDAANAAGPASDLLLQAQSADSITEFMQFLDDFESRLGTSVNGPDEQASETMLRLLIPTLQFHGPLTEFSKEETDIDHEFAEEFIRDMFEQTGNKTAIDTILSDEGDSGYAEIDDQTLPEFLSALVDLSQSRNDVPWERFDQMLGEEAMDEFMSRFVQSILSVYLIGIPEQAIDALDRELQ
jgi:hypothetical protein